MCRYMIIISAVNSENQDSFSVSYQYQDRNNFESLIQKFKLELSKKIHQDLHEVESLELVAFKIDQILTNENFYAFKIYPGCPEKMKVEKMEIERLIVDEI